MKVSLGIFTLLLLSKLAFASSGGHGSDEHGIPTVVLYQAINVGIIVVGGIYLGRKKIANFFEARKQQYLAAQSKAQSTLQQAEQEFQQMKTTYDKLMVNKDDSLAKAKADANDLRAQMVKEAHALSSKIQEEAKLSSKIEIERAKYQLKEQLVRDAFELSKRDLASKATSADQKKLQDDFISKVQVVQ